MGPQQWSVTAGQLSIAKAAREDFNRVGLVCGSIRHNSDFYVFEVRSDSPLPAIA